MVCQAQFTAFPVQQYFYLAFIDIVPSMEDILPSLVMPIWFLIWWQINDEHTRLGMFKPFLVARGFWGALSLQHEDLENKKLHKNNQFSTCSGSRAGWGRAGNRIPCSVKDQSHLERLVVGRIIFSHEDTTDT